MSDIAAPQILLAVNSTEWLNLCARGSIRMSKRRAIKVSTPATNREMERVFASAPFTKMESSVDLFVLQLSPEWPQPKSHHRAHPAEIFKLSLSDVLAHHPIASEHFNYYNNIALSVDINLDSPIYEGAWASWTFKEAIQASSEASEYLEDAFRFKPHGEIKKIGGYKWDEIAQLVLRPNETIKEKPGQIEILIRNIRTIADAVATTRDSEKFYLACAIEWIDVCTNKDPFQKKDTREILEQALDAATERPLGSPSEQTQGALEHLVQAFPKAFKTPISPILVANLVQLLTESRTRKLKTETVLRIFHSLDRTSDEASLISFVLATSLGIENTLQLRRALSANAPSDIDWDAVN